MITAKLLRAFIDCHLSAARILETLVNEAERKNAKAARIAARLDPSAKGSSDFLKGNVRHYLSRNQEPNNRVSKTEQYAECLYSIKEARDILRVSHSKIYQLIAQNVLPVVKIGKSTRLRWSDLEALMRRGGG